MQASRVALGGALSAAWIVYAGLAGAVDREACFSAAESAQQLRTQGLLRKARDALLVCAQADCPSSVRKDCARWLGEVKETLPTVVLTAHDPRGNDLVAVSVSVDGELLEKALDGRPVEIEPGPHTLRYEGVGLVPATKSIVVAAGQRLREISVEMAISTDAHASVATPARTGWPIPLPSIVLGAVGGVALVSMTAFWISGRSDYSSLETSCSPGCDPSKVDPVRAKLVAGDVSMGVALVSLGLATWFFLRPSASPTAPSVGFSPVERGGVASLKLVF